MGRGFELGRLALSPNSYCTKDRLSYTLSSCRPPLFSSKLESFAYCLFFPLDYASERARIMFALISEVIPAPRLVAGTQKSLGSFRNG